MPPRAASALISASDLLRTLSSQKFGLAWVIEIGRAERSIDSRVVRSDECDMSISMPTRFISLITSRPMRVMPVSSVS